MMKRTTIGLCAAGMALLLAACSSGGSTAAKSTSAGAGSASGSGSGSGSGSSSAPAAEAANLTVGTAPILVAVNLFGAVDDGDFAKNNLTVTSKPMTSGAEAIPLLLNGQLQFSVGDTVGTLTAISKNIPIVMIAQGNVGSADSATDTTAIQVMANSPIKTLNDLEGKTVAVNQLGGLAQIAALAAIDKAGGDSSKVKWVEIPIPQQIAAVQAGRVDAVVYSEPFKAAGLAAGLRTLSSPLSDAVPGVSQITYIASKSYAESHKAVVAEFIRSLASASTKLASDPDEIRALGMKYAGVPSAVAASMVLPQFGSVAPDVAGLTAMDKTMVKYGIVSGPVDIQASIFTGE
jgi:NitT/TauT family transport system substrate-binding protein